MHSFKAIEVLSSGLDGVNSCCVDAAVSKQIGKPNNISFQRVKGSCK